MDLTEQEKLSIESKTDTAIQSYNRYELAKGFIMYEYVRTLSPRQFREICERNMNGERFDDMIIREIANKKTQ